MYKVDLSELKTCNDSIDAPKTRHSRKIRKFINPNIEQIFYYFGPLLIILYMLLFPPKSYNS